MKRTQFCLALIFLTILSPLESHAKNLITNDIDWPILQFHTAHQAGSLEQKRELKSNRLVECLMSGQKLQLKNLLSDYREVSDSEIDDLFNSIDKHWGELSKSTQTDEQITFDKGDLDFIYHLQLTATHFGNWSLFSNSENESYLKIGVVFKKGTDKIGGVVVALLPK